MPASGSERERDWQTRAAVFESVLPLPARLRTAKTQIGKILFYGFVSRHSASLSICWSEGRCVPYYPEHLPQSRIFS
jgi:hypothetical protein